MKKVSITLAFILITGITNLSVAAPDLATYTYDAQGRITQVTYSNGTKIIYSYDAEGNRTSKTVTCSSGGC